MGMTNDLQPIQVRNDNTYEVREFPLTRAGLYNLVKFVMTTANVATTFNKTIYHTLSWLCLDDLLDRSYRQYTRITDDVHRIMNYRYEPTDYSCRFNYSVLNIVQAADHQRYFKSDVFDLNGKYYPRAWKKYLRRCEDCGEVYFDQLLIEEADQTRIIRYIRYSDIGYGEYCHDCCTEHDSDLVICADCGRIINTCSDDYAVVDDDYVCRSCLDSGDYACCDRCGEWFRTDSNEAQYPDDYHSYCCSNCCERDGWRWSDNRDCWLSEDDYDDDVDCIIPDYHSREVDFNFNGEMRKNQKHWLGGGTETEVDGQNRYDYDYDYFSDLLDKFGGTDYAYFEQDGSVEFEIISQPMTEKFFKSYDWKTPFDKLMADGWKSHDTTTCGRHYHYSDWYLGYTRKQKEDSAKKICRFFQLYADDIAKIARRSFGHYCMDLNNFPETITSKTEFRRLRGDRYWAVNLCNMNKGENSSTIEIRICRGTLVASTTVASFDFFLHIVRNAKSVPWKDISNLSRWFKGIKDKNTIDYIKSRHAFEGAF